MNDTGSEKKSTFIITFYNCLKISIVNILGSNYYKRSVFFKCNFCRVLVFFTDSFHDAHFHEQLSLFRPSNLKNPFY